MADIKKPNTTIKVGNEADKTSVTTEVKIGTVTSKTQTSVDTSGTVSVKETLETKLPGQAGLTFGVSAKTGSNAKTSENSSSTDISVSKSTTVDLGFTKFTAKASINIGADESSRPSALDPSIAIVKSDFGSTLKLACTNRTRQVWRRCLFFVVFLIAPVIWAQNNSQQDQVQPLLFNALKDQRFSAAYKKVFEPYLGLKWVSLGLGPTSPAEKKVLKNGEVVYVYSTCRPHACDAEYLFFIYAPGSGIGWGALTIRSDVESTVTNPEVANILFKLLEVKK